MERIATGPAAGNNRDASNAGLLLKFSGPSSGPRARHAERNAFFDVIVRKDIAVVERNKEATKFESPHAEALDSWVEDYVLGEIWEKNTVGEDAC